MSEKKATNANRKLNLAKNAKLKSDNVTIWTGVNADLGNKTMFVGGFIDGGQIAQVDGYYASESKVLDKLEAVLDDTGKIRLTVAAQMLNAEAAHKSAIERAATLAREYGQHVLAKEIEALTLKPLELTGITF